MRISGTLMNVAAVVAVTLAAGSLWHAYKVRYASDEVVEQAAAGDPPPAPAEAAPAVAAPAAPEPGIAAQPPAPTNNQTATEAPAAAPPTPKAPAALPATIAAEAQPEAPAAPSKSPVSLRDARQLSLPSISNAAAQPARIAEAPATITSATDRSPSAISKLLDRRSLNAAASSAAPAAPQTGTPTSDASPGGATAASLRDARPIARPMARPDVQDPRSLTEPRPEPVARTTSRSTSLAAAQPTPVASSVPAAMNVPATAAPAGQACAQPEITTEPLDGGLMRVQTTSLCRANQDVQLSYGGAVLIRRLDATGKLDFSLDCFAGTQSELIVMFADGTRHVQAVTARDLDKVSKTAVIWSAPVNLDLHAFEYSAPYGKAGHVWQHAASTLATAREIARAGQRGRGYLSTSDDGRAIGDKLEVYTFLHHDQQTSGSIAIGLDYETRGDIPSGSTCGPGAFAEVRYQVVTLRQGSPLARETGVFSAASCGQRIGPQVRFDPLLLPALRLYK